MTTIAQLAAENLARHTVKWLPATVPAVQLYEDDILGDDAHITRVFFGATHVTVHAIRQDGHIVKRRYPNVKRVAVLACEIDGKVNDHRVQLTEATTKTEPAKTERDHDAALVEYAAWTHARYMATHLDADLAAANAADRAVCRADHGMVTTAAWRYELDHDEANALNTSTSPPARTNRAYQVTRYTGGETYTERLDARNLDDAWSLVSDRNTVRSITAA